MIYRIDPAVSRFTVQAFATGMLSMLGHSPTMAIRDYTGEAQLSPEPTVSVRISAGSLSVMDKVSDKDRREMERTMNEQVLETARYPEIVFKSTAVSLDGNRAKVAGELTLHGVTRPHAFTAQVAVVGDSLRAQGEFIVSQRAYNIRPVRVAGGTLKLKDELKCSFEIVARAEAEESA